MAFASTEEHPSMLRMAPLRTEGGGRSHYTKSCGTLSSHALCTTQGGNGRGITAVFWENTIHQRASSWIST